MLNAFVFRDWWKNPYTPPPLTLIVTNSATPLPPLAHFPQANKVLLDALQSAATMEADSWAAVQCLSMENVTERIVIDKLIDNTQSIGGH